MGKGMFSVMAWTFPFLDIRIIRGTACWHRQSCIIEKALLYARLLKYEKDFIYQIPSTCCMERLAIVIPIQQQKPRASGLPPVLISLMIFVFRPTALMARTMKNLLSVFQWSKYICGYAG